MDFYAQGDPGAGANFAGAPQPPPPHPPGAAIGIDYGAGGDYVGAPGPPAAIRFVQEDEAQLRLVRLRLLRLVRLARVRRARRGQARRARLLCLTPGQLRLDVNQPVSLSRPLNQIND
ncbi:hypothetical protein EYF80_000691 [Liparis tanakae]|uniref:Uncharacterized protein n=1 Tax=Liparis tanakae TaxID=230148 RepID=A0A4Z2JG93_9TELE|nr:hypothetical protein EYF80_000691 [Liparis tanakae]